MKRPLLASVLVFATLAGSLEAACRQALAFGLDVSGSVDLREYRLQMNGLISALNDPDIVGILLDAPSAPVSIIVYEWSGPEDQAILVPWTVIDSRDALNSVSNQLALTHRRVSATGTALGLAMSFGASLLDQKSECWKRTLDISGDGRNNNGPRPRDVRPDIGARGITINALVIGADAPGLADRRQADISELSSYFRAEVIVGPDSFVQTALGFEDYAASMVAKLKKELDGLNLSELRPVARPAIHQ
jgi:hypothetical protein